MARTKQTARKQPLRQFGGQFGGKQPRTIPAPPPPPRPPQKLHECLAIIEQKTEPHYKAVACIDNKNINRVPEKELCKSVEATIDRVIQSCLLPLGSSSSNVFLIKALMFASNVSFVFAGAAVGAGAAAGASSMEAGRCVN